MYTVEGISIGKIILLFVVYVVLHVVIVLLYKKLQKDIENKTPTKEEKNLLKWVGRLDKWFPFMYVLFILRLFAI